METPSPIPSPSPEKPISRLKRIILAPTQPNSPKRPNREIIVAIEKLRPINKYKFDEPAGKSPNTKFSASNTKFMACGTSTPRKTCQANNSKSKSNTSSKVLILENLVLKKAPKLPIKNTDSQRHAEQQTLNTLQGQRLSLQQQLVQIEQQIQHNQSTSPTPPSAQTQQFQRTSPIAKLNENNSHHTPPSTPSPSNNISRPITTTVSPTMAQKQEKFMQQLQNHIANHKTLHVIAKSPQPPHKANIPWVIQSENQQQNQLQNTTPQQPAINKSLIHQASKLLTVNTPNNLQLAPQRTPKNQPNIPSPESNRNKASSKIPSVFIPHIASIERLTKMIDEDPSPITYTTTASQEGGVRIKCSDANSYNNLLQLLEKQNVQLHTHQKPEDKGFRIVIRNLHASTSTGTIRTVLAEQGFQVKYANVLKNRFTGIPLNMFEVEIDAKNYPQVENVLGITKIGNQEVSIERQAIRTDPVQCHRCQAFGHSKNYCRRPFVCLKCAGHHPTVECKKDKNSPGLCANCGSQHIASYKGCPTYKAERAKLLAVRLTRPLAIHENIPANAQKQQQPLMLPAAQEIPQTQPQTPTTKPPIQVLTPQSQRVRTRASKINSPRPAHNMPIPAPLETLSSAYGNLAKKTYSQMAHEAIARPKTPMPTKQNRQSLSRQLQLPQKLPFKPQQQHLQLRQPKSPQLASYAVNNTLASRQTTIPPHQHDLLQLHKAVASNAQSITLLSDKIDMLFTKFNEHFRSNPNDKLNAANDHLNDDEQ